MRILLTGSAGFIGNALALRLLERGDSVIGLDNLNPYYDVSLKEARLDRIRRHEGFREARISLEEGDKVAALFSETRPERVVHLAAQPGVRYSLENPHAYINSNLVGFTNILEGCRMHRVQHLVFASSSSVYGANTKVPFSVHDNVDHPISLYAATKKANELMAHTYSHLFRIPATGLRFFTVYGPWGRPDMAYFKFTQDILARQPIRVFNQGNMSRDFTFIDDIVEGIVRVVDHVPSPNSGWSGKKPDPGSSNGPYRLYNIGNSQPVELGRFIAVLEEQLDMPAKKVFLPMQPGDLQDTFADMNDMERDFGYTPQTTIEQGLSRFVAWFKEYYNV